MNIEEYKFEDEDVDNVNALEYNKGVGIVEINFCGGNCLHLYEDDVIALAKYFEITNNKER